MEKQSTGGMHELKLELKLELFSQRGIVNVILKQSTCLIVVIKANTNFVIVNSLCIKYYESVHNPESNTEFTEAYIISPTRKQSLRCYMIICEGKVISLCLLRK